MRRPKGVIAIAMLFGFAAVYLCALAAILLISPGAISLMAGKYFLRGFQLAGPYMILIAAAVYGAVAWGLTCLHNWARWIAMLIITWSLAAQVAGISMVWLGVPTLRYGLQIALHVAAGLYLAQAPAVIAAFAPERRESTRVVRDKS